MSPNTKSAKLSYPIAEAFEVIGVANRSAGYRLISEGKLKTFKVGRRTNATHQACIDCVELLQRETTGKAA